MLNCFSVTLYALISRNCKEVVTICHVIYYYNFKNISNKKIEIQMLNLCGDVYVEQNKFKISWSCHLDYKQTLTRDSINRVWLAIGYFALYLHCMHCLSLVWLKWLLTQHCCNSHINNSAILYFFVASGWAWVDYIL